MVNWERDKHGGQKEWPEQLLDGVRESRGYLKGCQGVGCAPELWALRDQARKPKGATGGR